MRYFTSFFNIWDNDVYKYIYKKGDIYLLPVANWFIVENRDDYLFELITPIEGDTIFEIKNKRLLLE
jgi:hypothetical protein